jgi:hypothetical protein
MAQYRIRGDSVYLRVNKRRWLVIPISELREIIKVIDEESECIKEYEDKVIYHRSRRGPKTIPRPVNEGV